MSGSTERTSTAPMPAEGFTIPPEENPIKFGAKAIRDLTTDLVAADLSGVFPKNYLYAVGDYNLIFHSIRDYGEQYGGFSVSNDMIVLTPKGEYQSGNVRHDVQDWTNSWGFREAYLKPASDLEIVKYSPDLLSKLFHQLVDELPEQADLEDVTKVVATLNTRRAILERVESISQTSLGEMGKNPNERQQDEKETAREKKKSDREDKLLRRANAALSLYKDKDQIALDIQEVVVGGRAQNAEEAVLAIQQRAIEDGLLKQDELEKWENLRVQSFHGNRIWNMVILDGKIQEAYAYYGKQEPNRICPEHTLERAPVIAQAIISRVVNNVFPGVELES